MITLVEDSVRRKDAEPDLCRIAILGTRGIPAGYGGFETFAERLSIELRQRHANSTV
jgi:hypothetical protein